jgi:hypothetical protein
MTLTVQGVKLLHKTSISRENNRIGAFPFWELGKVRFSRKSGKLTNFTLNIDFSVILNHMDLKHRTFFIQTLFYDRKKFQ